MHICCEDRFYQEVQSVYLPISLESATAIDKKNDLTWFSLERDFIHSSSFSQKMTHITIFCCNLIFSSQNVVGGKCAFRTKKLRDRVHITSRVKRTKLRKEGNSKYTGIDGIRQALSKYIRISFPDWIEFGFYTNPLESLDFFTYKIYSEKLVQ